MKNMYIFLVLLFISTFACEVNSADKIYYFYDSKIHTSPLFKTNSFLQKIDLNKSSKIDQYNNKRLNQIVGKERNLKRLEEIVKSDQSVLNGINALAKSKVQAQKLIGKYQIKKIPAVVLDTGEEQYIVYGQTNIQKALTDIAVYRRGSSY